MATRGRKPSPSALRLVTGNHNVTRHGPKQAVQTMVETAMTSFLPLEKPDHLGPEASAIWDRLIAPAGWLDGSKYAGAVAFCVLWGEFMTDPANFGAAKHGQMRAYASELGLSDERRRTTSDGAEEDPTDRYFS